MSAAHETKDVQDQSTALSRKRVLIIFVALALALFITCLDQTSVATSMAKIGEDLDAVSSIAWVCDLISTDTNSRIHAGILSIG